MADEASNPPSPFDVQTIRNLVALMSRHDLSEIDLRDGTARLRLRRGPRRITTTTATPVIAMPTAAPAAPSTPTAPPASAESETPSRPGKALIEIKSPTPGTFYAKPKPEDAPYVQRGSRVTPTTVVGLIEAMKLFNEITADCTGTIHEVVIENGQPVEYGQVLFRVDPSA